MAGSKSIRYESLSRWKYRLANEYVVHVFLGDLEFRGGDQIGPNSYISLAISGDLTISEGYCWDGPSGPTWDTRSAMRGSLVHDALYQLIREGSLPFKFRKTADKMFHKICREDGMGWFRASYFYRAVRTFGGSAAKPGKIQRPYIDAP